MTTRLSSFGALADRTDQTQARAVPRHVWVDGRLPGVLLAWNRESHGWSGYVVWARDSSGAVALDWLPASRLSPDPA